MRERKRHGMGGLAARALLVLALALAALPLAGPGAGRAWADDPESVPLLMVVVEFAGDGESGEVLYDDDYDWGSVVFGDHSLASYYRDMSGGAFTFVPASETCSAEEGQIHNEADREDDGVVHVTLSEARGDWGLVNDDPDVASEFAQVVLRAFRESAGWVDYASYDGDGDGLLSTEELAVCLCVAGYDASAFGDPARTDVPLIWPHAGILTEPGGGEAEVDGVRLESYIAIAEHLRFDYESPDEARQEPLGILYHELGHYLGLPDLYPVNGSPSLGTWGAWGVRKLSMMDTGGWAEAVAEDGSTYYAPAALDAWSRYVLGWEMPQVVVESGDYVVRSQQSDEGYRSLLVPTGNPDEYFLVENRQPEGHDLALAHEYADAASAGGVVVWHVDKGVYRRQVAENAVNNTDHRPAVMEEYFAAAPGGGFAADLTEGQPDLGQPFYSVGACEQNLGDAPATVALPVYGSGEAADDPAARAASGVTLSFPSEPAREMTVHVEFATDMAGTCAGGYPMDDGRVARLRVGADQLGEIACAALRREADAAVALVDAGSVAAGIAAGNVTYGDVAAVLPADSRIVAYDLTGEQLVAVLEESADLAADARQALAAGDDAAAYDAVLSAGGVSYTVDWGAEPGNRLSGVQVNNVDVSPELSYRVAVTQGVVRAYDVFDALLPDILVLHGSPADALRSFVQDPDWEEAAAVEAGVKTFVEPPTPDSVLSPSASDASDERGGAGPFPQPAILLAVQVGLGAAAAAVAVAALAVAVALAVRRARRRGR